jgi:hypothetical protein
MVASTPTSAYCLTAEVISTLRISRGAALRAVGWMRLFDDDHPMA